ncbi:cytochrome b5-like [Diorhabda carinulata]|uniref:cytochrome b5-like n=1 Tax=Diorhabda carinulata TaxID=1163345 RepID=UPI0025A301EF|nr:cytochrome b5-like [Diorhabda carinulata]
MNDIAKVKFYTLEEISKHDGKQDARTWIIIRDVVYDVTNYLDNHPGGGELITEWAGKDGTKDFDDFGHSLDAKKELKKLKIGEVVEEEKKNKKDNNKQLVKQKNEKVVVTLDNVPEKNCLSILTCGILT